MRQFEAIVIGASAGGMRALSTILATLPIDFPVPIIAVQHTPSDADGYFAEHLNAASAIPVKEADEKEPIRSGTVYLAPAGYHLLVEDDCAFSLSADPHVCFARPSIDVLFTSAADVYEQGLIGAVLTGANSDGADGLKRIQDRGGLTIVQDPTTAESPQMPQAALKATQTEHVLSLEEIGLFLQQLCFPQPKRATWHAHVASPIGGSL